MIVSKNKITGFPCRIGTTSYIIPADILPNLRFLKNIVDDVELVLFESHEYSNLPSAADVREMGAIAANSGLTFTVHLPLDVLPGAADENERRRSAEKWFRVIDRMAPLDPFGWIVHLNDPPSEDRPEFGVWQAQCGKTLGDLAGHIDSKKLCVETLSYDYNWVWPIVQENNCSVCLDIGHLVVNGYNVPACCDAWLHDTRVLHLHGVTEAGRDHVDLSHLDSGLVRDLLSRLKRDSQVPRVLTLEIFFEQDLETSLSILKESI